MPCIKNDAEFRSKSSRKAPLFTPSLRLRAGLRIRFNRISKISFGTISRTVVHRAVCPDFDNQPIRICLHADRKIGSVPGFKNHAAYARRRLRNPDTNQARITNFDTPGRQSGCEGGIVEVKINPFRITQAVGLILDLVL